MANNNNLTVKVTGNNVAVYTQERYEQALPNIVAPDLYTTLNAKASKAVRAELNELRTSQLNDYGMTKIGKNSKEGIKPAVRAIVEGFRKGDQPKAVEQVENASPKGNVKLTKAGNPDKRYTKNVIPAAKEEGKAFDYAAASALADAIERLKNAGFTKAEAKQMVAAIG